MSAPRLNFPYGSGGGGGGGVSGSGTTNTIPRWTGASALGDSGITDNGSTVSFVGRNLASTVAQAWTLATATNALNIQAGLMVFDTTNNRIGISATPNEKLMVGGGIRVAGPGSVASVTTGYPGVLSYESPTTRLYTGDGTGYSFAVSKRTGSVTTDILSVNDSTNAVTAVGPVRATGTAASAVAFSGAGDPNTGMYFPGTDTVRIAAGASIGMEIDSNGVFSINNGYGGLAPAYGCRAWVNFDSTVSGAWAGGASTVTRVAGSTTATITTTNNHGLITGNSVYALTGVAAGYYTITYVGVKTFTITTVATTALSAVAITFAVNNIRASGGVSSVTDISTGIFSVNFSAAMPDINYSAIGTKQNIASNSNVSLYDCLTTIGSAPGRTTTQCGWQCIESAVATDSTNVNIAVFR